MRTTGLAWLLAALAATSAAARMAPPATAPASQAASAAGEWAPVLQALREANSLSKAVKAYVSGGEAARRSLEVNAAYLRRLLRLGYPQTAAVPATVLVLREANDPAAYAVMGYNLGRENRLLDALMHTMKAARLVKDDASILNNLGQLAAWYEYGGAKTYQLSAADQALLNALKEERASQPAYAAAYKVIQEAYLKQAAAASRNEQAVKAAGDEVKTAQTQAEQAQAEVQAVEDEADAQRRNANRLGRRLADTNLSTSHRRMLEIERRQAEEAEDDIKDRKLPPVRKKLQDAAALLNQKRQALAAARRLPVDPVPLAKLFRWLPPAVDGVVTPQAGLAPPPATTSAPAG